MSLMRGDLYVFGDGVRMHIWTSHKRLDATKEARRAGFRSGVAVPMHKFEELVIIALGRMQMEGTYAAALERVLDGGGCMMCSQPIDGSFAGYCDACVAKSQAEITAWRRLHPDESDGDPHAHT